MITFRNIELRRGTRTLLSGVNLVINPGEKIGLVGRNGAGKSTFFALLTGDLQEEKGEVEIPEHWRLAQVEQHMPETDSSASDYVLESDAALQVASQALKAAEASNDGMAIAEAHLALADAGVHDALSRAQSLILGLGFKPHELDLPVNSFSGGWRMRLQLARALMCPSDLMLLDEPTNHLDLDALVWLESWLQRYSGTLVIISHDREFLDAVTKITLHIDHGQISRYGANYSGFETLRTQELILQQAAFVKQQDRINHLQHFIDRFKAKASKAKQAQSRVKALERMEKMSPMLNEADFTFAFKEPLQLPNPMIAIQNGSFGYKNDDESTVILSGVGRSVLSGQRIGILGANGQGKSTFIKTLSQSIPLVSGEMVQGKGLNIGYFAQQELDVLRPGQSPLEHMQDLARRGIGSSKEQEIRNFLGTFRFADTMVHQAVGTLSGGEKARLVLAMIVWQRPNLLLLDEPTNHLDLMTREALAMALNDFDGTVMLVSHDRSLLRSVCEEFWLVSRSGIADFKGDLDEYQRYLLEQSKAMKDEQSGKKANKSSPNSKRNPKSSTQPPETSEGLLSMTPNRTGDLAPANLSREDKKLEQQKRLERERALQAQIQPLKKELQATELRLQTVQAQVLTLEASLMKDLSPQERAQNGKALKSLQEEASNLEEKWLMLGEHIEQSHALPTA